MLGTNGHRAVLTAWLFSSLRGYIQNIKTILITSYISAVKKKKSLSTAFDISMA